MSAKHSGAVVWGAVVLLSACYKPKHGPEQPPLDPPRPNGDAGVTIHGDTIRDAGSRIYAAGVTVFHWDPAWNDPAGAPFTAPARTQFFSSTRPGLVLLEHKWPLEDGAGVPTSGQMDAFYSARYPAAFDQILGAGGQILIQVFGPPLWASSTTNTGPIMPGTTNRAIWTAAPPSSSNNYAAWDSAFTGLARWLVQRYPNEIDAGRVWIAYGAELPNEELYGSIADYAGGYRAAAVAAKSVSPSIRFGGGGRFDPWSPKSRPTAFATVKPVMEEWLSACRAANCTIDFVYGHNFSNNPIAWGPAGEPPVDDYQVLQTAMQTLLAQQGYASVELILTDWTSWDFHDNSQVHSWLSSDHDTEYKAAYLPASMIAMERAGMSRHTIGTLFEQINDRIAPGDFVGDWGLFTKSGIAKPALHGATMVSQLSGAQLLPVSFQGDNDPYLFTAAGKRGSALYVVVARFVPDARASSRMLVGSLGTRMLALGFTPERLISEGLGDKQTLNQVLATHTFGSATPSPETRALFEAWFALQDDCETAPLQTAVTMNVEGLKSATTLKHYRVDAQTSNSYKACVIDGASCSDAAAINQEPGALALVEARPVEVASGVGRVEFSVARHQVDLLVIEPAP